MTLVRHQWRRDTATNWTTNNPVLASGEPGFETDTGRFKVGDGISAWNSLIYQGTTGNTLVRVHRAAAFNMVAAEADLVFDQVSFGNAVLFNTTTGVYTTPSTGLYRVSIEVGATPPAGTDNGITFHINVNGTNISNIFRRSVTGSVNNGFGNSVVVSAAGGQAIKIRSSTSGGTWTGGVGTVVTYASFEKIP